MDTKKSRFLINGYIRLHIQPLIQSIIPTDLQTLFGLFYGMGRWGILFYNRDFQVFPTKSVIPSLSLLYDHCRIKEYNIIYDDQQNEPINARLSSVCYANHIPIDFTDNFTQKCMEYNISNPSGIIQCDCQSKMYSALVFDKNNNQNPNAFTYNLAINNRGNTKQNFKYSNINHSLYSVIPSQNKINIFNLQFKKNKTFNWNLLHSSDMPFQWVSYNYSGRNISKLELVNNDSNIWISTGYECTKTLCRMYNLQNNEWLHCPMLNAQILSNICYSNEYGNDNNNLFCYTNIGICNYELNKNKWFILCKNITNDKPLKVHLWHGDNQTLYYALETIDDFVVYFADLRCINGKNSWTLDHKLKKMLDIPCFLPIAF